MSEKEGSRKKTNTQAQAPGQKHHPRALVSRLAAESRRTEFRKYINRSGIMDALTNVLLELYEEKDKPDDAIEYLYDKLSTGNPVRSQLENFEEEKKQLEEKVNELEDESNRLKEHLEMYEPPIEFDDDEFGEEKRESEENIF